MCRFNEKCTYLHDDVGQECHFGTNCKMQHYQRNKLQAAVGAPQTRVVAPTEQPQAVLKKES